MTKSYPDRIADVLAMAPPAPPLQRKPMLYEPHVSDLTKAKLLMFHTVQATFGGPTAAPRI